MLNNITTDIDALKLEDQNIAIGGAAIEQAIGDEVTRAGTAESLISQNIAYESSRATAEEYALSQRITNEIAIVATTSLTTTMQAEIDALKLLVGINNVFSMIKTDQNIPGAGVFTLYTSFNTTIKTSPYISYVAPNINTGGSDTGFICQASGYYKIEYCFNAINMDYPDRVCWYSRIMINNVGKDQRTFIYTRANNVMYVQYGCASGSIIKYCNQNDYIQLLTLVAKNSKYFNDHFDNLRGDTGSNIIMTFLGN